MDKKLVLISDRCTQEAQVILEQAGFITVRRTRDDLAKENLEEVNGLLIRSKSEITRDLLRRAKKLQVIVTSTSGFDHIDLQATQDHGVTVMHTPKANVQSAAELTVALMLAASRALPSANRALKAGDWARDQLRGTELYGKTMGIVGLGRIGSRVCQLAQAFGMKVMAFDPYKDDDVFEALKAERVSFEELLKTVDVLSFHVPKTAETFHMLNRTHFEYIHRGIVIINTSRGTVISEPDLCDALDKSWVTACGLDVFEREPLPRNSKLLTFPQVVLSPHIGANTTEAFAKSSLEAAQKIRQFFIDGSTSDTLPPRVAWYGAQAPFKSISN